MVICFVVGSILIFTSIGIFLFKVLPYLDICLLGCSEIATRVSFLI